MIVLSYKQIRIGLGTLMLLMFFCLFIQFHFFLTVILEGQWEFVWVYVLMFYFWLPPVLCGVLCYLLLMRVFKYKEIIKSENDIKEGLK